MSTLLQASKQWATRPAEERFTSLPGMLAMLETQRAITRAAVVSSRKLRAVPLDDNQGLIIEGPNGHGYSPTHWSFGQAAQLTGAPAGYLRALPAPLAADCLNYGFHLVQQLLNPMIQCDILSKTRKQLKDRVRWNPTC